MGGGPSGTLFLSEEQRLVEIEAEFEGIWDVEAGSWIDHGHWLNIFIEIVIFPEIIYHIAFNFHWGRIGFVVGKGVDKIVLLLGLVVEKSWVLLTVSHGDGGQFLFVEGGGFL